MNPICALGRLACILAVLAAAALTVTAAAPAAFAKPIPPPGWNKHPPLPAHVHPLATGGMPGWQISLIAAAAVLAAIATVVLVARARAARRRATASPA
jgi:hypothetical protein